MPTLLGSPCRGSVWLMTQELRSTLHPPSRRTSDKFLSEHITSAAASRLLAFHHLMNEQRTPATDSGPSNQNKLPTLICPQTSSTTKQLKGFSLNFTSRRGHKIYKDVALNLARTKCAQKSAYHKPSHDLKLTNSTNSIPTSGKTSTPLNVPPLNTSYTQTKSNYRCKSEQNYTR